MLGTGDLLSVSVDSLSEGRHVIVLQAVDSDGDSSFIQDLDMVPSDDASGASSIIVHVYRDRPYVGPQLQVTPAELEMTVNEGETISMTLPTRNVGDGGTISWTVTSDPVYAWMHLSAPSGTTPDDLVLSVDAGDLSTGVYTGTLMFNASGAATQVVTMPYTVQVAAFSAYKIYLPLVLCNN